MRAALSRTHIALAGRLGAARRSARNTGGLRGLSALCQVSSRTHIALAGWLGAARRSARSMRQAFSALSSSSLSKPSFMWCAPRGPRTMR